MYMYIVHVQSYTDTCMYMYILYIHMYMYIHVPVYINYWFSLSSEVHHGAVSYSKQAILSSFTGWKNSKASGELEIDTTCITT